MPGFLRRFDNDPGNAAILAIEGAVIIDREPPATIGGVGTGTVCVVGEWENGQFNEPTEITSGTDLAFRLGEFGYVYDTVPGGNPCARARKADGALVNEFWNGHGHIAVVNKRFARLVAVRADTSVGAVEFIRLACLVGNNFPTYDLEPAQTIVTDSGAGPLTATFTATVATLVSAAGIYPTTFVGGESMVITIDELTTGKTIGPITVTFTVDDQTQAQVVSRINAALGYTAASIAGGGVTNLVSRVRGSGARARVVSVSGVLVTTATGFSAAVASGTGNVADIDAVTVAEANTVISAVNADIVVDRDASGKIRICNFVDGATGTLLVGLTSTADSFGWPEGIPADAAVGVAGTIPAGTRVRNVGGVEWVIMQDVVVAATGTGSAGPYSVKVRPGLDDGTIGSALAATVTTIPFAIQLGGFKVTNPLPLSAALSEAAIDAAYVTAIDSTKRINSVAKEVVKIVSARQSNIIRSTLRSNANDVNPLGLRGRMCIIRPPLGTTTRAQARSATQPGVGAYRDKRLVYCYPGTTTFISQIAARGTAGGLGFTADGIIDVGSDTFLSSIASQLAPEENPGQETAFTSGMLGIERGNPDVQNLTEVDYESFKAAGICAPKFNGSPTFQSGVTSVDPAVQPQFKNIARQQMSDFIGDSLAIRAQAFVKKLSTPARRAAILGEVTQFMDSLLSPDNPASQRIDGYTIDARSGNTDATLALGIFRIIIKVRTLASIDDIVLDITAGESVVVTELPLAA